jgi:hypothetical protein
VLITFGTVLVFNVILPSTCKSVHRRTKLAEMHFMRSVAIRALRISGEDVEEKSD